MIFQIFVSLLIGVFVYSFIPAHAGAACVPVYGGGPTCTSNTSLSIDSKIKPGDPITFHITLTNTGTKPITNIVVKDNFPPVLAFVRGPGQFDTHTHILTFTLTTLAPHASQSFTITARVASQNSPQQCLTNTVSALPSQGVVTQDSSQFCLTNITSTPSTGPEAVIWLILLPIGMVGIWIKKIHRLQAS